MGAGLDIAGVWREDRHGEAGWRESGGAVFVGPRGTIEFYPGTVGNTVDHKISHAHGRPHRGRLVRTVSKRRQGVDSRVDAGVHNRAADR